MDACIPLPLVRRRTLPKLGRRALPSLPL